MSSFAPTSRQKGFSIYTKRPQGLIYGIPFSAVYFLFPFSVLFDFFTYFLSLSTVSKPASLLSKPSELGICSQLQVIQLRSNRLIGNVTADFSRLSHLKELDLGSNKLNGEIPEEIALQKQRKLILLIAMVVGGIGLFVVFCCGYIYSLLRWWKRWMTGEKKRSTGSASSGADQSRESSTSFR
ncbi:hypothetical protein ES319_D07G125200v1 [Gossypium barbadense]|uniref:Leucine-rich repeat-containing N-terminal plant-type domain-containing protein n=1 Tax=Gossypium barbadense TaxID=3634 RepID=A0A5J5QWV3_GOSBA|nr:hypothetical protein ES319_D07G125200v1 [Gossypium barbadense]